MKTPENRTALNRRQALAGAGAAAFSLVAGRAALAAGKKTAELTEADLPSIKDVLLKMKANAKLVGEVTASQTALATGEVDILVGGGEHHAHHQLKRVCGRWHERTEEAVQPRMRVIHAGER